jgi:hypothetical protein
VSIGMQKHVEPLSIATAEEDNACSLDFLVNGEVGHESFRLCR